MQKYSKKVMEHFTRPHNQGGIKNPDGVGLVGNPKCGDIMRMYIKVTKNKKADPCMESAFFVSSGRLQVAFFYYFIVNENSPAIFAYNNLSMHTDIELTLRRNLTKAAATSITFDGNNS